MRYSNVLAVVLAAVLACASLDSDAASRLGGGRSVGRQSSNVTQREAGQPAQRPGAPSQAANNAPAPPATPAAAPRSGFGGFFGGLVAGLGLFWLASSLGLGSGFAHFLLFLLLVVVIASIWGAVARSRRIATVPAAGPRTGGYDFQPAPPEVREPRQYNPDKVGNDASARPWERNSMAFDAARYSNVRIGSALEGKPGWMVPAGFDTEAFVAAAKRNFVTLQDAWDHADLKILRSMMTDRMLGEIRDELAERESQAGARAEGRTRTEVVMLEAQLLGIEDVADEYMASVEFSGMIREDASAGPSPFREVWNMTKPKNGSSGWLVAGVQALQ
ncbi:MAG TPA: Tim44-like domain-containing protein [Ramlibacter sp.]|uniref:Tim44 domain-containing protein n=1 Tax=Ramlibacter sp. TaxID=1917967 RepID=UPI002BB674C5|nr:Tim44-like domain-containing protein [Ramlibacter sp.]HVZ42436.1 Tim44-like domain-containing protein [Ramlibacter sp.]